jgi:protoheme IX farnesyltransferase
MTHLTDSQPLPLRQNNATAIAATAPNQPISPPHTCGGSTHRFPAGSTADTTPITRPRRSYPKIYADLGKFRLSAMVVVTTGLGFVVASHQLSTPLDFPCLLWTCLGTFLAAIGAAAFNQAIECRRDKRMLRTKNRPIPAGEISATHAAFFALLACIAGIAILCPTSNGLTAVLGFLNILLYVAIYTPMKPHSTANTLVGAIVGAIPPMMGWSAATGSLSAGAWLLAALLFIWQIPHFLALAWMYREDYARGGYKMISTVEPSGRLTTLLCILYSIALIPITTAITFLGHAGIPFAVIAALLGAMLVFLSLKFAKSRSNKNAKKLFLATILYLPLLTVILIANAKGPYDTLTQVHAGQVLNPNLTQNP